jgi:hypothetical protein
MPRSPPAPYAATDRVSAQPGVRFRAVSSGDWDSLTAMAFPTTEAPSGNTSSNSIGNRLPSGTAILISLCTVIDNWLKPVLA